MTDSKVKTTVCRAAAAKIYRVLSRLERRDGSDRKTRRSLLSRLGSCKQPEVVAAVFSGDGIHRVGTQLAQPGGFRNGFPDGAADANLVDAHGRVDYERGHPRVLADGALIFVRHVHVGQND